ncbi:hypothetical protein GMRT_13215 [Giardia muris]|uniref:Uncharacterized protein n=1 Tax=Giardia muris TaxID=5742 RepID=A0A4Z1T7Y3_GIAMU|nr:hypothetical protein GMRT_13215 [Giardia muris]|eukprot:TNJ28689.1 hypothetical protein GMRT_13215 [Giardia muris]
MLIREPVSIGTRVAHPSLRTRSVGCFFELLSVQAKSLNLEERLDGLRHEMIRSSVIRPVTALCNYSQLLLGTREGILTNTKDIVYRHQTRHVGVTKLMACEALIAIAFYDGCIDLLDPKTFARLRNLSLPNEFATDLIFIGPEAYKILAISGSWGGLYLYDIPRETFIYTLDPIDQLEHQRTTLALWDRTGSLYQASNGIVSLFDLRSSSSPIKTYSWPNDKATCITIAMKDELVVGLGSSALSIISSKTGRERLALLHPDPPFQLAMVSSYLISGSRRRLCYLDMKVGEHNPTRIIPLDHPLASFAPGLNNTLTIGLRTGHCILLGGTGAGDDEKMRAGINATI